MTRPPRSRSLVAVLVAALAALAPCAVRAQPAAPPAPRDPVAAESLFAEARTMVDAGRFAEACPKFAESHRLDPGIGVLLHLGNCWEKAGRLASAWAAYREAMFAAQTAGQDERAGAAQAQIAALEPRLPRLTIVAPPAPRPRGLLVRRDGIEVGEPLFASGVFVDPGDHVVEATAPGHTPWRTTVRTEEGKTQTVNIPALAIDPSAAPPSPGAPSSAGAARRDGGWSGQRTAGAVLAGVGAVGLVVGTITGAMTLSSWSEAQGNCSRGAEPLICNDVGQAASDDAHGTAAVSTIAFVAGGLLVAGGAVLFLTGGDGEDAGAAAVTPWVGPGVGGGAMTGRF